MASHGLQIKNVDSGEASINYYVAGDGPAICLLASTGRSGGDFKELAHELVRRGYKVILPEPRGIGGSTGPMAGLDFHDLATDVSATIKAETDNAVVAGHAFGCWIARTVAADYPELIRGLALIAAGSGQWPAELPQAIDCLASSDATRQQRIDALKLAFFAEGNDPESWLEGWHADVIAMQRAARAKTDKASWWHSGNAPILDVIALQDPFRPEQSRNNFVEEFGERVTIDTIDGASHALPDEKPLEVAQCLARWIATLETVKI
ncbi:MAG: alpha/beta fold hydrolase [Granulosicoccus sp.]